MGSRALFGLGYRRWSYVLCIYESESDLRTFLISSIDRDRFPSVERGLFGHWTSMLFEFWWLLVSPNTLTLMRWLTSMLALSLLIKWFLSIFNGALDTYVLEGVFEWLWTISGQLWSLLIDFCVSVGQLKEDSDPVTMQMQLQAHLGFEDESQMNTLASYTA